MSALQPLGPGVAERFAWSRDVTDAQIAQGRAFRARFRAHLAELLGSDGVLVMPTMPDIAPLRSEGEAGLEVYRNRATTMLCSAGLSGFPQVSLPLATRIGAPLGLSLLGPAGSDRSLIEIGSIVLDNVVVGEESLVAAGSLVTPGTVIPPRSLVMGSPAKVKRQVTEEEIARIDEHWKNYIEYKNTYLAERG